ncbi:MAG: hypothetical protein OYG31_01450 [Candidatus Kaiserbacteria bacterium]|nr:hypothetical protein [Candidatus Kaiserbacteria bacterium]
MKIIAYPLVLLALLGCSTTTDLDALWKEGYKAGQGKIIHTEVGGIEQCVVLVSATSHSEKAARRLAYRKGVAVLGEEARRLDSRIVHQSAKGYTVHMLVTAVR